MGRLYDQMKRDLELRNFSPHTRRTYLACLRRFALYFHRSPVELGDPEIREYLHYLIKERKVSQGAVTQAYGALKFFYETTLKRDWEGFRIPKGKGGRRLPTVLSQQEVEALWGRDRVYGDPAYLVPNLDRPSYPHSFRPAASLI